MTTETESPGVSLDLFGIFVECMEKRYPNRAAAHDKTNLIIYHLGVAERIYETLPEVKEPKP